MASKLDDLFAMKWILPEHNQALSHHYYKSSLIPQPILEDDELVEMNRIIHESIQEDFAVSMSWFKPEVDDLGRMKTHWGWVQRVDTNRKQIKLVNDDGFWWIDFKRLVKVERV
ncbi:YolD-like family protein [Brevibacillus sp. DP1.3A]|uniref:YolD-like family protein n=1 Tax=Brevibacillus sp. DP1.3A TaxID=2738867 RepID=UPI00156AE73E|nr:YolD-like family protein [Brevibacillus sp. DP1.3A]UED78068.1 YolD-like family protein [Brevibacillus sp. DP1.3A]